MLTCQSEGYPRTNVTWRDGNHRELTSRTTTETTSDQRFKVISLIKVSSSDRNNYTCTFADEGPSATFNIPGIMPTCSKHMNPDVFSFQKSDIYLKAQLVSYRELDYCIYACLCLSLVTLVYFSQAKSCIPHADAGLNKGLRLIGRIIIIMLYNIINYHRYVAQGALSKCRISGIACLQMIY